MKIGRVLICPGAIVVGIHVQLLMAIAVKESHLVCIGRAGDKPLIVLVVPVARMRLQLEHPVVECALAVDLLQIRGCEIPRLGATDGAGIAGIAKISTGHATVLEPCAIGA